MMSRLSRLARAMLIWAIRLYQLTISPVLGPRCRFYPSCSSYAAEAVTLHGVLWGLGLGTWRLLRCHPWNPGGLDPVPVTRPSMRLSTRLVRSRPQHPSSGAG